MNLYHCMIELKDGAKALAFASACEAWLGHLQGRGVIRSWRLLRRNPPVFAAIPDPMANMRGLMLGYIKKVWSNS